MKELFPGYYSPTKDEKRDLLKRAIVCFDANVILNLYRYSDATRAAWLEALGQIAKDKRLWLPYQAALEYQSGRLDVIRQARDSYDAISAELDRSLENAQKALRSTKQFDQADHARWEAEFKKAFDAVKQDLSERKAQHPNRLERDEIRPSVDELFKGCIGVRLVDQEKRNKEFEERIQRKIPPGFEDAAKPIPDRYGDIVLWFEILEKAKEDFDIVFVTDDLKKDWWEMVDGKKRLGPLPALGQEFTLTTGRAFYMYAPDQFLNVLDLKQADKTAAVAETKDVSERLRAEEDFQTSFAELVKVTDRTVARSAVSRLATLHPGLFENGNPVDDQIVSLLMSEGLTPEQVGIAVELLQTGQIRVNPYRAVRGASGSAYPRSELGKYLAEKKITDEARSRDIPYDTLRRIAQEEIAKLRDKRSRDTKEPEDPKRKK